MAFRDLNFGTLDARDMISRRNPQSSKEFIDNYLPPPQIKIADYKTGDKYFLLGKRGSGKTALLCYLNETLNPKLHSSDFLIFKDLSNAELERLASASTQFFDVEQVDQPRIEKAGSDLAYAWMVFLLRRLSGSMQRHGNVCANDSAFERFSKACNAPFEAQSFGALLGAWFRSLLGGKIRIGPEWLKHEADLAALGKSNLDPSEEVETARWVEKIIALLEDLNFKPNTAAYLFVDELNLEFGDSAQRERDVRLIRDLIEAVERLNRLFDAARKPIFVICSVRSEVLEAVGFNSGELNKSIHSRGDEIRWTRRTPRDAFRDSAFINYLNKKLATLDPDPSIPESRRVEALFRDFSENRPYGKMPAEYLYTHTWARPRDLVVFFEACKRKLPNSTHIGRNALKSILEDCQSEYWKERHQELILLMTEEEIDGTKKVLGNLKRRFKPDEFESACNSLRDANTGLARLLKRKPPSEILRDLYNASIIGRIERETYYWSYEGHDFERSGEYAVHAGLIHELGVRK